MANLTLQVRTRDNLLELLAKNETGNWIVGKERIHQITHVHVVNFEGTQRIEGVFVQDASYYLAHPKGDRLVVKFLDGRIVNCNVKFIGENPVKYIQDNPPN